jgi:hypothetical protein
VCAPGKTPRAAGDRVKTDRKDAELLARLLLAGQLRAIRVPPDWLEAARHLARSAKASSRPGLAAGPRRELFAAGVSDDLAERGAPDGG